MARSKQVQILGARCHSMRVYMTQVASMIQSDHGRLGRNGLDAVFACCVLSF